MHRRLIVMRHAKSSWKSGATSDAERPLNERGRRDAPRVAARLDDLGWRPERVLCSTATRARETWERMAAVLGEGAAVELSDALYLAGPREVGQALEGLPDTVAAALVLGHNPGWEEVVAWLSGEPVRLTTANAALLTTEATTWRAALERAPGWTLEGVLRPKELD